MPALRRSEIRSRIAASGLALLTAVSLWLSLGTLAVSGGDTLRIAALPSLWILTALAIAAVASAQVVRLRLEHAWPLAISLILWLPFFPGPVPAALLIWQGPIEGVIWLVVAVGLIAARPPSAPSLTTDPSKAPWIAAGFVGLAALIVFSQVRDVMPGGDEPHYLAATQSLLRDGDLRVANNYEQGDYLQYFPGRLEPHFLRRSTGGEIYSIHAPGVSAIVLPAFAVAGYPGAVLTMVLIAALTAALTWRLAFRVSGRIAGAWISVAAIFATTPYFFHTFAIYPEIIGSLLVMIGVWLLLELDDGREVSARTLALVGCGSSILPWLHSRFAVIAALLGLIIIARLLQRSEAIKRIAAFLAVPVIAGIGWLAYFYAIWGIPSPTAPYGADTSTSASYILRGLVGLLFDQQFGILTTAPVYLMAIAGAWVLLQRQPRLAFELFVIIAAYSATTASYAMWWAGNAAPARFVVSVLPIAALPIALVGTQTTTIVLLVVSIALAVPRGIVEGGRFIFNNRGGVDATIEWITRSVDLSLALPSVHRDGASIAVRDGVLWLVVFGASVLVAGMFVQRRSSAARYAATAIGAALAVIVASSIVWSLHGQPVLTPDRSKLAALAAYRPAWHRTPRGQRDYLDHLSITINGPARLNRVPAAAYEVLPTSGSGAWRVFVGRNDAPLEQFDDQPDRLRLPLMLQTLNVSQVSVTLRPQSVFPPVATGNAIRAARYGYTRAYFLDERAYPERDGFWTRADASSQVVISTQELGAEADWPMVVTAGSVPTTVTLSTPGWEQRLALGAGEKRQVSLPGSNGAWPLRITSGAGFRPSERAPGNADVRKLAAWIAFPR